MSSKMYCDHCGVDLVYGVQKRVLLCPNPITTMSYNLPEKILDLCDNCYKELIEKVGK